MTQSGQLCSNLKQLQSLFGDERVSRKSKVGRARNCLSPGYSRAFDRSFQLTITKSRKFRMVWPEDLIRTGYPEVVKGTVELGPADDTRVHNHSHVSVGEVLPCQTSKMMFVDK